MSKGGGGGKKKKKREPFSGPHVLSTIHMRFYMYSTKGKPRCEKRPVCTERSGEAGRTERYEGESANGRTTLWAAEPREAAMARTRRRVWLGEGGCGATAMFR